MAALGIGFFHGELTTLLWGGAFGFVWLYVAVAGFLASRARTLGPPQGTLAVHPEGSLVFQTEKVPWAPALFSWLVEVEGIHSPTRGFRLRRPLGHHVVFAPPSARGLYRTTARWELGDAFGFFRWCPQATWEACLMVPPSPRPFMPPQPPRVGQGVWRPRKAGPRAGDPFDVRPYLPGDDLRRLHWPLYAHSGQPFVRTADPSPPTGRWQLVLDTEARDEEELDHRLGALVTWLELLEGRHEDWTLEVPGVTPAVVVRPGQPWLEPMAGLRPTPLPSAPPTSGTFALITGPTSRGGRVWRDSGANFQTVVIEAPPRVPAPRRPWWAR